MSAEVEWGDPPVVNNRTDWHEIAAVLRSRPGKWAKVKTCASSNVAAAIKRGSLLAFQPSGSYDARCVGTSNPSKKDIYARYVGDPSDA